MFSSSPLDKNCINSDSCSSSRNNASNRFSVGIAPLGDENQQIRIQLAVHKYNGTTGSSFNNRCTFMSPIRHSFLKNSLKVRNYEGDYEGTSKADKRKGNQYEGVGAFPTIHLKKNALRYRPIRRFHDVKIPYPELPVNRFLSHLPEVCPDLKSSTRSFLDVLEDLSGNKIYSKDDNGCSKPKPQGLGGDYLLNPTAVFKPLFVQKPKLNAVLTRDNTTQTLSPISMETPSPQGASSSHVRNGPPDPRAELRRKLAKQNNEIFASLSSSISSAFCLKRKIDKVFPSKEDGQFGEGSALKKTKMSDHCPRGSNENGLAKTVIAPPVTPNESIKLNKKSKFSDTNSVSPSKDRLTTIFLDTRNTSPKARIFQANTSSEKGSPVASTYHSETNGESADKTESPLANSFAGGNGRNERTQRSTNFSSLEKLDKQEVGQSDKSVVSSFTSKTNTTTKDTAQPTASPLRLGVTAEDTSSFSSPKTVIGNASYSSEPSKSTGNGNDLEKKENSDSGKEMSGSFNFGKAYDKAIFGPFKFGVDGSTPLAQNKIFTDFKGTTAGPAPTANIAPSNSTTQFSLGTTSSVASPLQTSSLCFGTSGSQNTFMSPGKTTFAFGYTSPPGQQTPTNIEGKLATPIMTPTSSATTTPVQSNQPVTFTFAQKPMVSSASTNHVSPAATVSVAPSITKNSWSLTGTSGPVLASEQKPELSVTSASPAPVIQEQIETSPFVFGQKETQVESGQKSANVFSTEQKPTPQSSTQGSAVPTDATAPNQPSTAQTNQAFAQVVSTATAAPQVTIIQNSVSQASTAFGTKFEGSSSKGLPASELNPANPVFPNKTVSFGSSVNSFGKTITPTTRGFTTSTSSAPAFDFQVAATTQSVSPFGVSPGVQSSPTFISSSTPQSAPIFGSSSTTQSAPTFGTSSTTQSAPTFGTSSTTQSAPTFGTSSTTQSAPTFGSSSAAQSAPIFGSSSATQSAPTFGTSSTTQSAPTFISSSTTQPITAFASAPAAQIAPAFGVPASHCTPGFLVSSTTQTPPTFDTSSAPHSTPAFGSSSKQLVPSFGTISTTQSTTPTFPGVSSQPPFPFGTPATTQTTAPLMPFKLSSSNNASMLFGTQTATQSPPRFGPTTTQNNITFGPSPGFTTPFSTPPTTSPPAFVASHSLDKPIACPSSASVFAQNPSPAFSSSNVFTVNQNNIFARKPATETPMLEQNKAQTSGFGATSQVFGTQNKFSFGTSTSNATGFTNSLPTTTAPMVYSFGGGTTGNTFTFGSNSSAPSNTQTPFAFGSAAIEPFKFGATTTATATTSTSTTTTTTTTTKGGTLFGGGPSTTFSFAGQMNNSPVVEQKPSFNFGTTQTSTAAPGFHFGTTPSPSVFNFGGSSSSGSSGSSFNFGTPTGGVGFGQTAPPGAPFAVPGTFNIGSGSSQSRPRASSRPRRRP